VANFTDFTIFAIKKLHLVRQFGESNKCVQVFHTRLLYEWVNVKVVGLTKDYKASMPKKLHVHASHVKAVQILEVSK
jgi:hypothetical protein